MGMYVKAVRLRLFFVTLFFLAVTVFRTIPAMAGEIRIRAATDRTGAVVREVEGKSLFISTGFLPGESEEGTLRVSSSLSAPVYLEWKCSSGQQNDLYRALELEIRRRGGELVYQGPLRSLDGMSGPLMTGGEDIYDLVLSLPAEADSKSAGQKADFHILLTFSSNVSSGGSGSGESNGGSGESGNQGGGGNGQPGSGNGQGSGSGTGNSGGSGSGGSSSGTGSSGNGSSSGNSGSAGGAGGSGSSGSTPGSGTPGGSSGVTGGSGSSGSGASGSSSGGSGGSGSSGSGSGGSSGSGSSGGSGSGSSGGSGGSGSGSGSSGGSSGSSGSGGGAYSQGTDAAGVRTITSPLYNPSGQNGHGFLGGGAGDGFSGGGKEMVYPAPDLSLKSGIDSGSWVLDPAADSRGSQDGARDGSSSGAWKYRISSGDYLKNGFALIKNPYDSGGQRFGWFYFDGGGIMQICWIKGDQDIWYHAHEQPDGFLGMIETGWLRCDGDGRQYYLDEKTAAMQSGWIGFVNSMSVCDYYYFARLEDTYKQNWFLNTALGRWIYDRLGGRSYGSMYADEKTPDGSIVDKSGRKIQ